MNHPSDMCAQASNRKVACNGHLIILYPTRNSLWSSCKISTRQYMDVYLPTLPSRESIDAYAILPLILCLVNDMSWAWENNINYLMNINCTSLLDLFFVAWYTWYVSISIQSIGLPFGCVMLVASAPSVFLPSPVWTLKDSCFCAISHQCAVTLSFADAVDELNQDSIAGKCRPNSYFTPPTKSYGQVCTFSVLSFFYDTFFTIFLWLRLTFFQMLWLLFLVICRIRGQHLLQS